MITAIMTTEIPGSEPGHEEVEIIRHAGVTSGVDYFTVRPFGIESTFNVSITRLGAFSLVNLDADASEGR